LYLYENLICVLQVQSAVFLVRPVSGHLVVDLHGRREMNVKSRDACGSLRLQRAQCRYVSGAVRCAPAERSALPRRGF